MGISEDRLVEQIASKSQEIYYLESILRQYRQFAEQYSVNSESYSIGMDVMWDNLEWFEEYVEYLKRKLKEIT